MKELPKIYDPAKYEDAVYRRWEESGFFNPDKLSNTTGIYCDILPPPNANGELHLGHASGYAIMDLFGRFQRMHGKKTLLLPGKDHAGIQTQVVFERKLLEEKGLSRHDLGRDAFFQQCYDFCIGRSSYMRSQEKRIGLSADWNRETFTLDPEVSQRAIKTFVKMYEDNLIYRGERIINWCPRCSTALSDIEVIHKETPGKLFFIPYPIKESSESITVATTRPETMLGDMAVAVHPDDSRYTKLIGKTIILPLTNREIPIIADERVDASFGTGAVKITPAHDQLDWDIAQTHGLEALQIIDKNGNIAPNGGRFAGLSVSEARKRIIEELRPEEHDHLLNISLCERCKHTIEPLVSKQWFVKVDSLKKRALEGIRNGDITFYPESMGKQMISWLENLRDWCISRQLWWGHRVPVWYCINCNRKTFESFYYDTERKVEGVGSGFTRHGDAHGNWHFDANHIKREMEDTGMIIPSQANPSHIGEKIDKCPKCKHENTLIQDPDTLDTWFSSGQWPYTTLGYPDKKDAEVFYPTDTMVMGRDLLFFWAARMILFGYYTTGQAPFRNLYFTGLVRDKEGRKMSKSKGNGIDVLEMIDRFGADAVRMSLIIGTTPGLDFRLYEEKIASYRNFTNKLWNIARFVASRLPESGNRQSAIGKIELDSSKFILAKMELLIEDVTQDLEAYQFSQAGEKLRDFTWNVFADWYVEAAKFEKNQEEVQSILSRVFQDLLKLWHPFMPFVTETLWREMGCGKDDTDLLMVAPWPTSDIYRGADEQSANNTTRNFALIGDIVKVIRNLRSEHGIEPGKKVPVTISMSGAGRSLLEMLERNAHLITALRTNISELSIETNFKPEERCISQAVNASIAIFIPQKDAIDVEKERARLKKEITNLSNYRDGLKKRLANDAYVKNAPQELVKQTRETLEETEQKLQSLQNAKHQLT